MARNRNERNETDKSVTNPFDRDILGDWDMERYNAVKDAFRRRNIPIPPHETILRIMGEIDAMRYDRRMTARMPMNAPKTGRTELPIRNRPDMHIPEQIGASIASGSFGSQTTRPWRGGYKGPRAVDTVPSGAPMPIEVTRRTR